MISAWRTPFLVALQVMLLPVYVTHPASSSSSTTGSVVEIGGMHTARACHTSTLLPNGKVLIAGGFAGSGAESQPYNSAEIYDPELRRFQTAGSMLIGRSGHTATLLRIGKVLIVGGWTGRYDVRRTAELYDAASNKFSPTGEMGTERADSTAALLADGRVLISGGVDRNMNALSSAELYDPVSGVFVPAGNMKEPHGAAHTATVLRDGKVLITGGGSGRYPSQTIYRAAELYDPATGKFTTTGPMMVARHKHAAVLLPDNRVLIVGGSDNRDWRGQYSSAELYDPLTGKFTATADMSTTRFKLPDAIVLLPGGKVLVAGGGSFAEIYDPAKRIFSRTGGSLGSAHFFASATLLPDGQALITGGYYESDGALPSAINAWLYRP
jgi:hypothetical protein